MRRSILTEKISRRGLHLSREYAVDPLEITVRARRDAHQRGRPAGRRRRSAARRSLTRRPPSPRPTSLPGLESDDALVGVVTASELRAGDRGVALDRRDRPLATLVRTAPVVAFADEPLRAVAYRMAETGFTRVPVVDRTTGRDLEGMLALTDLLRARAHHLEQEQQRERVLRLRRLIPAGAGTDAGRSRPHRPQTQLAGVKYGIGSTVGLYSKHGG